MTQELILQLESVIELYRKKTGELPLPEGDGHITAEKGGVITQILGKGIKLDSTLIEEMMLNSERPLLVDAWATPMNYQVIVSKAENGKEIAFPAIYSFGEGADQNDKRSWISNSQFEAYLMQK